jgi:hypothetical protein
MVSGIVVLILSLGLMIGEGGLGAGARVESSKDVGMVKYYEAHQSKRGRRQGRVIAVDGYSADRG